MKRKYFWLLISIVFIVFSAIFTFLSRNYSQPAKLGYDPDPDNSVIMPIFARIPAHHPLISPAWDNISQDCVSGVMVSCSLISQWPVMVAPVSGPVI
jgi:hypothetical protein